MRFDLRANFLDPPPPYRATDVEISERDSKGSNRDSAAFANDRPPRSAEIQRQPSSGHNRSNSAIDVFADNHQAQ